MNWVELATKSHTEHAASLAALNRRVTAYVSALTDSIVAQSSADGQVTFSMSDESRTGCTIRAQHDETSVTVKCEVILAQDEHKLQLNTDADVLGELTGFNTDDDVTPALEATADYVGLALATAKS